MGSPPSEAAAGGPGNLEWLDLYRVLLEEAEDVNTVVDAEGRIRYANAGARRLFGLSEQDCVGRSAFDWIHPDDRERTERAFQDWLAEGSDRPIRFENRQVAHDGSTHEMAWAIYALRDEAGVVTGFASTATDVTERRRAERALRESETVHRALLDGLLEPAVSIDADGIIQQASRSVEAVFGYRPSELIGRNVKILMPDPYRSEHDGYLETYHRTGVTNILGRTREFEAVRKDGTRIHIELSVARVDPETRPEPLFIGSIRDVTERERARRAEQSMLRALAALGESSAVLAHEIKNPITAVNVALRAVARSLGEDDQAVLEDLVRRMKRLEQQLRQTLSFAKAIELHRVTCDPNDLLREVTHAQQPLADGAGIDVDWHVEPGTPSFDADFPRLEEVLTNLLVNAFEMLPSGGTVRLSAAPQGAGNVRLTVEDDGPGIPSSVRDTLFRPFVTTKDEGTGLGLPICRRIIDEHGGTIEVVDGQLGGAGFRITLPVRAPAESASRSPDEH